MEPGTRFVAEITRVWLVQPGVAIALSEGGFLPPNETQLPQEQLGIQSYLIVRDGDAWRAAFLQRTRIIPPKSAAR
jgi:hypothetical protein